MLMLQALRFSLLRTSLGVSLATRENTIQRPVGTEKALGANILRRALNQIQNKIIFFLNFIGSQNYKFSSMFGAQKRTRICGYFTRLN